MGYVPPRSPLPNELVILGPNAGKGGCGDLFLEDARLSGYDNIAFGYSALLPVGNHRTDPFEAQDAPDFYHCAYCGSKNNRTREECRSCRAPL